MKGFYDPILKDVSWNMHIFVVMKGLYDPILKDVSWSMHIFVVMKGLYDPILKDVSWNMLMFELDFRLSGRSRAHFRNLHALQSSWRASWALPWRGMPRSFATRREPISKPGRPS